ncbi:hypothetical protein Aduo_001189 [Ancylostoma duodenale]
MPLRVFRPTQDDLQRLRDRAGSFNNYCVDPSTAKQWMTRVFSVSCSALSAISTMEDNRRTHWLTATVPTLTVHPLSLTFTLTDMASEAGWEPRRPVVIWVSGALNLSRATVRRSTLDWGRKLLHVTVDAFAWSSRTLEKATKNFGRPRADDDGYSIDICVRLTKAPPTANPT